MLFYEIMILSVIDLTLLPPSKNMLVFFYVVGCSYALLTMVCDVTRKLKYNVKIELA